MWVLTLVLVATLADAESPLECTAYICDPPGLELPPSKCSIRGPFADNVYTIKSDACREGEICDLSGDFGTCVLPARHSLAEEADRKQSRLGRAFRGEPCSDSSECKGEVQCVAGKCESRPLFSPCEGDNDCSLNTTCTRGVCFPLSEVGGICTKDSQCVQNAACDKFSGENFGHCVKYFSAPEGKRIDYCGNRNSASINPLCESSVCADIDGIGVCIDSMPHWSYSPLYHERFTNFTLFCSYAMKAGLLEQPCECGNDGSAYCPLLPFEDQMKRYLKSVQEYLDSAEIKACSSLRKVKGAFPSYMDHWCAMETYKPSQGKINDYYRAVHYNKVMTTQRCVLKQLLPLFSP